MASVYSVFVHFPSEQLIRSAFQCAQLVAGDLLGAAGPRCLRRVLAAAAGFARQTRDLNISLTAVGLMVLTYTICLYMSNTMKSHTISLVLYKVKQCDCASVV